MKLGIIGCGNMGNAIIKGIISNNLISNSSIYVYDVDTTKTNQLKEEIGINVSPNYEKIFLDTEIVLLVIKPNVCEKVLTELKEYVTKDHIIISIMAGVTIHNIENIIGTEFKIVRVMPNTPALVNEAMSGFSINKNINSKEKEKIVSILNSFGTSSLIDESLMDVVTGISGSSPAFVFIMIEAMADAAVKCGMPREKAYEFISQTVLGSAKMVLKTKKHPAVLKDMVTSPSGTTIAAIESLEKNNFRYSLIEAVNSATKRSKELAKNKK